MPATLRTVRPPTLLLVGCALFLTACGDSAPFPGMGSTSLELPRGIPASELPSPSSQGARLTAEYCSSCHGIPSPRRHTVEDWEVVVRRMVRRMDHMERHMGGDLGGMMMGGGDIGVPTVEERRQIMAYLGANALQPARAGELPEDDARDLFVERCSQCHAPPAPGQHSPDEWTDVVDRMQRTATEMEVAEISNPEAREIVRYLEAAAGDAP